MILIKLFLPISLAIIMFGMGMTLIPLDFTRVLKYPKAIIIGLTNQLILLPIIGFSLAIGFNLESTMAIGVIILAVCPGGPTSNLVTQVCKGNIALSVTLTAITSFISIVTIPFILSFAMRYFNSNFGVTVELSIIETIKQIMVITVIPIVIGMLIRKFKPVFANRMEVPMRKASTIIFIVIFIAIVATKYDMIAEGMRKVGFLTLLLNISTMGIGYLTARLFKLDFKNAISITVESGIQNGTLAFVIAITILNNMEMVIPTAAYSIWMYITGLLMWILGKRK